MELRYLSSVFYQKYNDCTEIMRKGETRPYIIILIEVENNKFAIPIRTNLHKTKDCYESNPQANSGLDYTKAVVISHGDYIDSTKYPEIEHKEYNYIKIQRARNKNSLCKICCRL